MLLKYVSRLFVVPVTAHALVIYFAFPVQTEAEAVNIAVCVALWLDIVWFVLAMSLDGLH